MPIASYKGLGAVGPAVEFLSTLSTVLTLTDNQQGLFLVYPGQSSAVRIRLPAPEAGKYFHLAFNGPAVSTATKITSSGVYDIVINGTTAKGVAFASTVELGAVLEVFGINEFRWLAVSQGSTLTGRTFQSTTT